MRNEKVVEEKSRGPKHSLREKLKNIPKNNLQKKRHYDKKDTQKITIKKQ